MFSKQGPNHWTRFFYKKDKIGTAFFLPSCFDIIISSHSFKKRRGNLKEFWLVFYSLDTHYTLGIFY